MQLQAGQPDKKGNKRGAAYAYNIKELRNREIDVARPHYRVGSGIGAFVLRIGEFSPSLKGEPVSAFGVSDCKSSCSERDMKLTLYLHLVGLYFGTLCARFA